MMRAAFSALTRNGFGCGSFSIMGVATNPGCTVVVVMP